ncbi:hypothetical protein [Streptomyces sp. NPDC087300]|uniref:hypothetical protein n=1 Tax=Streptomyces sp. NPDC087300 TaxID=3365780 RepID=UPI003818B140
MRRKPRSATVTLTYTVTVNGHRDLGDYLMTNAMTTSLNGHRSLRDARRLHSVTTKVATMEFKKASDAGFRDRCSAPGVGVGEGPGGGSVGSGTTAAGSLEQSGSVVPSGQLVPGLVPLTWLVSFPSPEPSGLTVTE